MTYQPPENANPYGQPPGPPSPYPQHPQPPYGQPYYGGPPPTNKGTNGFAIAALVLGILWLYWVGSILALIFGYVARRQIKENHQNGDGMAIAGIVLGWIGVGMLLLVIVVAAVGAGSGSSGY